MRRLVLRINVRIHAYGQNPVPRDPVSYVLLPAVTLSTHICTHAHPYGYGMLHASSKNDITPPGYRLTSSFQLSFWQAVCSCRN